MARPGRPVRPGKKDGRPTKFTPEVIARIEMLAGVGLTIKQICLMVDVSDRQLQENVKLREELSSALERGKAKAQGNVGKSLYERAVKGDVNAIRWYEMTRCGRREKVDVESNNVNEHNVTTVTPEQRKRRIKELEAKRRAADDED